MQSVQFFNHCRSVIHQYDSERSNICHLTKFSEHILVIRAYPRYNSSHK